MSANFDAAMRAANSIAEYDMGIASVDINKDGSVCLFVQRKYKEQPDPVFVEVTLEAPAKLHNILTFVQDSYTQLEIDNELTPWGVAYGN